MIIEIYQQDEEKKQEWIEYTSEVPKHSQDENRRIDGDQQSARIEGIGYKGQVIIVFY